MLAHVYSFSTETREKLMSKMSDIFGEHKATAGFAGIFVISGSIMIGTAWSQAASYDRDPCASHSEAAAKPAETRPAATGTVTTPAANKEPKATKPTTVISVGPSASVVFGAPICVIVDGLSAMTIGSPASPFPERRTDVVGTRTGGGCEQASRLVSTGSEGG
jgi:hypothetical protein